MFGIIKYLSKKRKRIQETETNTQTVIESKIARCQQILAEEQGFRWTLMSKLPERAAGRPVPWYTYPAIEYVNQIDVSGLKIFEYGCGQSSLYFAGRGALVWSVDHDEGWHREMSAKLTSNNKKLLLRREKSSYAKAISEIDEIFDIIIIDGVWRNECAIAALPWLRPDGIIILDNSDWYIDVSDTLKQNGFFQVDFNGFGPCNEYCWTTSLLFRSETVIRSRIKHPKPVGGIIIDEKGEKW